jgi:autotransporter-associated beta strand protein
VDAKGNMIVVWSYATTREVYARQFTSLGSLVSPEFRVDSIGTELVAAAFSPSVTMDADGNFAVVWRALVNGETDSHIWARWFKVDEESGQLIAGGREVIDSNVGPLAAPKLTMNARGEAVAVWNRILPDGTSRIDARLYDTSGRPRSGAFQVNGTTDSQREFPQVAMDHQGNVAIVWSENDATGSHYEMRWLDKWGNLLANGLDSDGLTWSANGYRVAESQDAMTQSAALAVTPEGEVIVVWPERLPGTGHGLGAQLFTAQAPQILDVTTSSDRNKIVVGFTQLMAISGAGTVGRVRDDSRPDLFIAPNWGLRLPDGRFIIQPTELDDPRATPEQFGDITFGFNHTSGRWEAAISLTHNGESSPLEAGTYTLIARGSMQDAAGRPLHSNGDYSSLSFTLNPPPFVTVPKSDLGLRSRSLDVVDVSFGQPIVAGSFTAGSIVLERDGERIDLSGATLGFVPSHVNPAVWKVSGLADFTSSDGTYTITIKSDGIIGVDGLAAAGQAMLKFTMDATAPQASFEEVAETRRTSLSGLTIVFVEPVAGLQLDDFVFTRDGETVSLVGVTLESKRLALPVDYVSTDTGRVIRPANTSGTGASTVQIAKNIPSSRLPSGVSTGAVFRYVGLELIEGINLGAENYADPDRWRLVSSPYVYEYILGGNLSSLTNVHGNYQLRLMSGSDIVDRAGNPMIKDTSISWSLDSSISVYANEEYTLAGDFVPFGTALLVKREPGTLIVDQANAHTGGTVIEAGTVVAMDEMALGSGRLVVSDGAKLRIAAPSRVLRTTELDLSPAGRIDIGLGSLRINSGGFDISALEQAITEGRILSEVGGGQGIDLTIDAFNGDAVITVAPTAPTAADDFAFTFKGEIVDINVLANDSILSGAIDPATVKVVQAPSNGSVTVLPSGVIRFTPNPGFAGRTQLGYVVSNNVGTASNVAMVTIRVQNSRWQNPRGSLDVDADGSITAIDVLVIINYLNGDNDLFLPNTGIKSPPFLDPTGDEYVDPLDALLVINYLNGHSQSGEGEGFAAPVYFMVTTPSEFKQSAENLVIRKRQHETVWKIPQGESEKTPSKISHLAVETLTVEREELASLNAGSEQLITDTDVLEDFFSRFGRFDIIGW